MTGHEDRPEPVRRAARYGHSVGWDPPSGLTFARRWTCFTCGAAVLINEHGVWGEAIEKTCEAVLAGWRRMGLSP